MFESFKKITIKGGCFENSTELELFKKDSMSVIYGRNGSGKTTIAHSIAELVKSDEEKNADYTVSADVVIPEEKKQSVFIFDEDFVRDQVRVEKDGIDTIVMLGEQVELDEQIARKKGELTKKEEEYGKLEEERKKYDDPKDAISPLYYFNELREALRADGGWAEIDRQVKGNRVMSRITEDVISGLMALEEPKESYEQLKDQLMADLKLYLESENAQEVVWEPRSLSLPDTLDNLCALLERTIDAPPLNEREQRLVALLAMHSQYSMRDTKHMIEEGWSFCPLCLREIEEKDRVTITQTITDILNKEAEEYEEMLKVSLDSFASIETELPIFSGGLNEKELNAAQAAQRNLNGQLTAIREKIGLRKRDIYEALKDPFSADVIKAYSDALTAWKSAQIELQRCVERFNDSVNKRKKLYDQIREENNLLSRKQLDALLQSYGQAIKNSGKNIKDLEDKEGECNTLKGEIKTLQQKKENTDIALSYINKQLQYVFYNNRKVKLEPGDGCYKLKINGRNVAPKKISVGERNVLGLCYFFAKLFGGKTEASKYTSEYLIVIDDPVSSFDYGNRIGVMSLLRYQFGNILKGNANSRILVMSHDLHSVFDLVKIRNELVPAKRSDKSFMELVNNTLEVKFVQNEYKKLLEYVYSYAENTGTDDPDELQEMSIGNVMRRLMEAFSSFCYNDTFEKMVRREDVLNLITEPPRSYYANFMGRLTLNTESHMEERVYTLDTITTYFTKNEKIQTAKSVLLFLLHINKSHLAAYLDEDQLNTIESWKMEEAGWLVE